MYSHTLYIYDIEGILLRETPILQRKRNVFPVSSKPRPHLSHFGFSFGPCPSRWATACVTQLSRSDDSRLFLTPIFKRIVTISPLIRCIL